MKRLSKFLAAALSVLMIITALPLSVLADTFDDAGEKNTQQPISDRVDDLDLSAVSIVSENVEKRAENVKHFNLDNGTSLAVQYHQPVHTLDEGGNWIDIDHAFSVNKDGYVRETDTIVTRLFDEACASIADLEGDNSVSFAPVLNAGSCDSAEKTDLSDEDDVPELTGELAKTEAEDGAMELTAETVETTDEDIISNTAEESSEASGESEIIEISDESTETSVKNDIPEILEESTSAVESEAENETVNETTEETIYEKNIRIIEQAVTSSEIKYEDVFSCADISYEAIENGFQQSIIIKEKLDEYEFSFTMDVGELTASINEKGTVNIADEDGTVIYTVGIPYMYDSEDRFSDAVMYELTEKDNGRYVVTVKADSEWISADDTAFPVTALATITRIGEDSAAPSEAYVSSLNPDTAYNGNYSVKVGKDSSGDVNRAFFSLDNLPEFEETDVVLSAILRTYECEISDGKTPADVEAHRIMAPWDAGTVTWNSQPEFLPDTLKKTASSKEEPVSFAEWDITILACDWYSQKEVCGVAFTSTDETSCASASYLTSSASAAHPYIFVHYIHVDLDDPEETDSARSEETAVWENVDSFIIGDAGDVSEEAAGDGLNSASEYSAMSSGEFNQTTSGITLEYSVDGVWNELNSSVNVDHLDGVRILTSGKPYWFKYKAKTEGKWLSAVPSTSSSEYAGLYGHSISNIGIEVYEGSKIIYDNYVVMYRAKTAGNWLTWVSNGNPSVMDSIKAQFGLDGGLDYIHTEAGDGRYGVIEALDIRVYERVGYSSLPGENQFREITDFSQKYFVNGTWSPLNSGITVDHMDGVQLGTDSKDYYLWYKTLNIGHSDLAYVSSTDSGVYDYAGLPDCAITNIYIEVHNSSGNRIYDDYVVMYRAKVAGDWLDWVSNGNPDVMYRIQAEFGLGGGLDVDCTEAGYAAKGNIEALEIRLFERISGSGSGGTVVSGSNFQAASGIAMKYRVGSKWETLTSSDISSAADGIFLQTNEKPYYFMYRSAYENKDNWLPLVSSRKNGEYDYAGLPGRSIKNLEIRVYNNENKRIYDNYVVMYRAKVDGSWLAWASNGNPPIMDSIKAQFGLDGALDKGTVEVINGTVGDDYNIQALDIRVYERKGFVAGPSPNAVIINAPYINQEYVGMRNGCESVSTVMALQYFNVPIDTAKFVKDYLDRDVAPIRGIGPDPEEVFVGEPSSESGWGCYSSVILKALNKFIGQYNLRADRFIGKSLSSLCSEYIDKNIPVILWATVEMTDVYAIRTWKTPAGKTINYNSRLHCLLLVGYDENFYYFNDPLKDTGSQKYIGYPRAKTEKAYGLLGMQAVVISNGSGLPMEPGNSESPEIIPDENKTVSESTEINTAPSLNESLVEDPIDLSRGAHVIDSTLMKIYGAHTISFNARYSSDLLKTGQLGTGWSHNYEKSLADYGTFIRVHDNPTYYADYTPIEGSSNLYDSDTITKEGYVISKFDDRYEINCNEQFTEYYDKYGRLYHIKTKDGFDTRIDYVDDSTVRIFEDISGRYIKIEKDQNGKIFKVSDNTGRSCVLGYTGNLLTSITDENGNTIFYQYNENGQIERGMDALGTVYFSDKYDSVGRITSQHDAVSGHSNTMISYDETSDPGYTIVKLIDRSMQTSFYKYNSSKQLVSKTDANGVETTYEYDAAGNVIKQTDGLDNSIVSVYNEKNSLISSTDKNGNETKYFYDDRNNLTKILYPNGSFVTYTYDERNHLISSTDLRGALTVYEYNSDDLLIKKSCAGRIFEYEYENGQAVSVTDPLGRETVNQYGESGFLTASTDAGGNTTHYTYDNKGNVLTVTDAAGNISSKVYDANGNILKSTDAGGHFTEYSYDGNMNMISMTMPIGSTIHYEYDNEDRPLKTSFPHGYTTENEYDAGGRIIGKTDQEGNKTSYEYDAAGNVVKITNPLGGVTLKEYDAAGNLTKSTDLTDVYDIWDVRYEEPDIQPVVQESVTTYQYDSFGRLTKMINGLGGETVYVYNNAGDLLSVTDAVGNTTVNTYDSFGNLLSVTDPRGNTTHYSYDISGNLLTVTNALGQITTNTYDSLNRLISTTDPGGHIVSYTYDELGRQTSRTDARGNTVHQYYDAMGNVIKITDEDNDIDFEAVYDEGGRAITVTDDAGNVTQNYYDYAGNLTKQVDALGGIVSYSYDGVGNMVSSVDRAGSVSYATYDGMGNLTSTTGPLGSSREYTYNSAGQLVKKDAQVDEYEMSVYSYNALGLKEESIGELFDNQVNTYDAAGRIVRIKEGGVETTYTYDANGNVLKVKDGTGTVTREYDALNRVIKYTDVNGNTIRYEYDACGNLSKMIYPTGDEGTYTYDANHNMIKTAMSDGKESTFEYNTRNLVKRIDNPDGSFVTKTYDSAGRLSVVNDRDKDGKHLFAYIYQYDQLGRILKELNPIIMVEYQMEYDELGRVTKRKEYHYSTDEYLNEETYTYDAAGNILTATSEDGTTDTYTYGADNEILAMNGVHYGTYADGTICHHKVDGRMETMSYDYKSRLKKVKGDLYEYWYDAENTRANMYYEHTNMMYTYDASDGRNRLVWMKDHKYNTTIYTYGAEGLQWGKCNENEYKIYHYDYRGSVVMVTDIDGNIIDEIRYDTYGKVIARMATDRLVVGYNGRDGVLTDPTGILYMRNRYYSPELRRFMSADEISGSIADSSTLNVFAYVNGNPISFVDPSGLSKDHGQNNENVINDLHWLYNCSYDYFSSYTNEAERIRVTNEAVMKYLISERYYNASFLSGIAWDMLAGELDTGYFIYMSQHKEFLSVRESTFYDPDSGEEIDFVHMIATLSACYYESTSGALFTIPSAYAGWAGDLISLAGEVAEKVPENYDIVKFTKELMSSTDSRFPNSDLIGDIDAVLINEYMSKMPIDKAFETYYASDYKDRYSKFFAKEFGGYINNVYSSAEHYLSPGLYNFAFRKAFHSEYSNDIIPYVAQGFTEYFVYEVGR